MNNDIRNHKFIVFCIDHYNPLGMCRSLGEENINPIVVLVGKNPILINHCKYVKQLHLVSTREEGLDLIISIYGHEDAKPFLLTCDDRTTELLDQHFDELINKFYFFNCGKKGEVAHFMNKEAICDVAERCGISKPKGEILGRNELPKDLNYPIITKVTMSIKGAWKKDVHICNSAEELSEIWPSIKADEILAQEYIDKKNELCVDGISINGGEEVWFPYTSEYIRFTEQGYGNYMWMKVYDDKEVRAKIQNILKEIHFSGIFSLECLIDKNDNLYFLEVNLRNSTWSYAYTFAGLNLPYQWATSTLAGHIDYKSAKIRTNPFTAMAELNDWEDVKRLKSESFLSWLKQVITCDVLFLYNKKDKAPFNAVLKNRILGILEAKLGIRLSKTR